MTSQQKRIRFKQKLQEPGIIPSLGVHDVFSAMIMEQAGLELLFLGGFGASASYLGLPDMGYLTMPEICGIIRRLDDRLEIPFIADGDTGFGDLNQVRRTVQQFEKSGATGILLEDQVFPKRCGHFQGKQVIPADQMLDKLKVALDSRQDPNFIIMARTDAIAVEGFDSAIERICKYGELGVDLCFVEAQESAEQLKKVPELVPYPLMANMLIGGKTPLFKANELEQMGYEIMVSPVSSLMMTGFAIRKLATTLLKEGSVTSLKDEMFEFDELKKILGVDA
jgi:2-methylisocitrate lyase-like PEP mutase family enzyme